MTAATMALPSLLNRLGEYEQVKTALKEHQSPLALTGLSAIHRAHWIAALHRDMGKPAVIVCADESEAKRIQEDLSALLGKYVPLLTAREFQFHPGIASHQWEHRRLAIFDALRRGDCPLLVATVEGLMQRTLPPERFHQEIRTLSVGQRCPLEKLADGLTGAGYARCEQVEGPGQFALRGGILDVFSPGLDLPVRLEFWGDEIDSMGLFDPVTQRRTAQRNTCVLLPASEVLGAESDPPDLDLPRVYKTLNTAAEYLPAEALVFFCDTPRIADRAKSYLWQLGEDVTALLEQGISFHTKKPVFAGSFEELCAQLTKHPFLYLDMFATGGLPVPPKFLRSLTARQLSGYGISFSALVEDLRQYQKEKYAVVVLASTRRKAESLQSMFREEKVYAAFDEGLHDLPKAREIVIAVGGLTAGFDYPDGKFALLSEGSAPPPRKPRKAKTPSNRQKLESFTDLAPGDLIVHEHHGIGRFVGMVDMTVDGTHRDYIKLQFAGADTLYVPALQLDLVSKYIGSGGDGKKALSKLGGTEWKKSKAKAKKAAKDMAKGLIQLYAQRQRLAGYAFSPDTPWQREFETLFPYPETDDQLRAAEEIKADMEKPIPMDRLLCGDVGYGKTEVAFRAVMKCVLEGKQAAILVPTTVLAQQHYMTALKRFSHFPVRIEMISRYRTPAQMRDILRRLAAGEIDLLVGTHKLLGKDIVFKDLGLLVVDEEQRFGVSHKEKLKKMAHQVDVLTLSATPIPRTLNMALSGLRDMSTLEQPPTNRQPVQTYVMEHDWGLLADAIRRELERGGQVFYLHNVTETIDRTAAKLRAVLGEGPVIATAHGKMEQEMLSDVMSRMTEGEVDILVCTTIIETGIDLPNVNTLIIEDAERLGLAQLHQLRGRVGRSTRRAFAYLTYRQNKILTEDQSKRLGAIREYAAFGSGFKIAMRDLEIRGAGNLLGAEQSGFLISVGYDLYLQLLEEAVLEEQGKPPKQKLECLADLTVTAAIPETYVKAPEQRMDLYRRIARIETKEDADDRLDELIDRYGEPPKGVQNLVAIALLRAKAAKAGITEVVQKENLLRFTLPKPNFETISAMCGMEKYNRRLLFSAGDKPSLNFRLKKGEDVVKLAGFVVQDYGAEKQGGAYHHRDESKMR